MNPKIILEGKEINVRNEAGLYKVVIDGTLFTGQTFNGLVDAIKYFYPIYVQLDKPEEPKSVEVIIESVVFVEEKPVPHVQQLIDILTTALLLSDRQEALRQLEGLADPIAVEAIRIIKTKPLSFNAAYITRLLNKNHFSEVTSDQIFEFFTDIIQRSLLLEELSRIVRL